MKLHPAGAAWRLAVGAAAVLAALSGCAVSSPPPPSTRPPPAAIHQAALENTYWKLMSLRGEAVAVAEAEREPHLVLHTEQRRVAGSGGCNRLLGTYVLDGPRLSFGPTAGTKMACPGNMAQEQVFLDTLSKVSNWRINGERLDLLDGDGNPLARFESRYLQ